MPRQRWEHAVIEIDGMPKFMQQLEDMGNEGWEVVTYHRLHGVMGDEDTHLAVLKRQHLPNDETA